MTARTPSAPRRHHLANGVTLVCDPAPGFETLALSVVAGRGARWDEARSGWSHLLEHMVFKGAGGRSARDSLARLDPRKVQVVEMRFFGGLSVEETAEVLKISAVTVKRDWRAARTWLFRELTGASTADVPRTLETS